MVNEKNKTRITQYAFLFITLAICTAIAIFLLVKYKKSVKITKATSVTYIYEVDHAGDNSTISYDTSTLSTTSDTSAHWIQDASLSKGRSSFGAVLLPNEHIMIAGGRCNSSTILRGFELYSASTGWNFTSNMKEFRYQYTLTTFANNTKVLAAGTEYPTTQQTAEVYDIKNKTWTLTSTNMSTGRYLHTATLLQNGYILIIGGKNSSGTILSDVDIFMPSSNSFSKVNSLNMGRYLFTSTLLNNGSTVLVTGGGNTDNQMTSTAELYVSGSWIPTNTQMTQPRAYHSAVLLPNGNVLIAGGGDGGTVSYSTAEIYNPTTRTFKSTASMKYRRGS
ncbi:unnamed protein product, partial [Adineta steineri]